MIVRWMRGQGSLLLRVGGIFVEPKSVMQRSEVREKAGKDGLNISLNNCTGSEEQWSRGESSPGARLGERGLSRDWWCGCEGSENFKKTVSFDYLPPEPSSLTTDPVCSLVIES